jgi:hypothetical protein
MSGRDGGGIIMPPDRPVRRPTHRTVMYLPNGPPVVVCDIEPTSLARGVRGYCKYCYRTHKSWWLMPAEEYPVVIETGDDDDTRALLCGYCEHVSLAVFMDLSS